MGIFHRDGAPLEGERLRNMTDSLAYRGPDGSGIWLGSNIGLGHTLLTTARKSRSELHPVQLESMWITADVRLDSKTELLKELEAAGRRFNEPPSDSELLLHAYAEWGPECVEHLRGDFGFGIWDSKAKTLFCARDHFGIKPFYYAALGGVFLFSNTINCLRRHPAVTSKLNEATIGDFLLFGSNYDNTTTTFQDIQRLPPAHTMLVSRDSLHMKRYWRPPTQERIRYSRSADYVDNFNELLRAAVIDRLPVDSAGIFLSGGLDSGAVAAVASAFCRSHGGLPDLRSYTLGYDYLIRDGEGFYATKLADYLGIPNNYLALDDIELFEKWDDLEYRFPEPVENPLSAGLFEQFRRVAVHSRVALSGEGADNLMYFQMWPYIKDLRRNQEWSRLAGETAWFLWIRPLPWLGITRRVQSIFRRMGGFSGFPSWLDRDFVKRAGLEARWKECTGFAIPLAEQHPSRTKAHASMLFPQWTSFFESEDPGITHYPVEVRYPFLDLRLVHYLLAIPAFPWMYKKRLLRESMIGRLPEELRLRAKTPLPLDPVATKIKLRGKEWMVNQQLSERIREFVEPTKLGVFYDTIEVERFRAYCLGMWLKAVNK